MDFWMIVGRLLLAFVLGGLVGWEREREDKPAGLRTLILVSIGSALFVLVTQVVDASTANAESIDLLRIVAGVAQGVGFLGAGTIFTSRGTVHGLTTAAAIWAMSAVGVACGFGVWRIALVGTVLTFVALRLLGPLAMRIGNRWDHMRASGECEKDG